MGTGTTSRTGSCILLLSSIFSKAMCSHRVEKARAESNLTIMRFFDDARSTWVGKTTPQHGHPVWFQCGRIGAFCKAGQATHWAATHVTSPLQLATIEPLGPHKVQGCQPRRRPHPRLMLPCGNRPAHPTLSAPSSNASVPMSHQLAATEAQLFLPLTNEDNKRF